MLRDWFHRLRLIVIVLLGFDNVPCIPFVQNDAGNDACKGRGE